MVSSLGPLNAKGVSVHRGKAKILTSVSLSVHPGEFVALLGPNGSGKTTLLQALLGLNSLTAGSVLYDGRVINGLSPQERARHFAYLPQERDLAWPVSVRDVVALGRFAYGSLLGTPHEGDRRAIASALNACDLAHLAERAADSLSGGELARVHLARALAGETPFLIADEPVAALDPLHELRVMELVSAYVAKGGGALIVVHDISLAARFADRLIWLKDGAVAAEGTPNETVTRERMGEIYGVDTQIEMRNGRPSVHVVGAI